MLTDLLRNQRFVLLWCTQIFVTLGDALFNLGVMVTVYERTQSTLQTALVSVAVTSPSFLFSPIAGVLIDRYPRRWILIGVNLARALLVGTLVWFLAPDSFNLVGVYVVVFCLALTGTLYRPAISATIPSIVAGDALVSANSVIMTSNIAVMALSYIFGGMLIVQLGIVNVVTITISVYAIATLLVAMIPFAKRPADREIVAPPSIFSSIKEGLQYIRGHDLARSLLSMEAIEYVPHGLWTTALMLSFTQNALGAGVVEFGYQSASYYIGQWMGGLVAVVLAARLGRRPGWIIIGNAFIFGLLTIAYAASPNMVWAIGLCFIFGPPSAIRDITQESLLQATIDPKIRGRVSATKEMLGNLFFTVGSVGFAWLADITTVQTVYFIGGGLYLVTAAYAFLSRPIRNATIASMPLVRSEDEIEVTTTA